MGGTIDDVKKTLMEALVKVLGKKQKKIVLKRLKKAVQIISILSIWTLSKGAKMTEERLRKECGLKSDECISSNNEIYKKAKNVIWKHKKLVKHFTTCLEAGICPTCGVDLQLKIEKGQEDKIICPNNHKIIHPLYKDSNCPKCALYGHCINPEIRQRHFAAPRNYN